MSSDGASVLAAVDRWEDSLLDLGASNPLLNFRAPGALRLDKPDSARIIAGLTSPGASHTMTLRDEPIEAADQIVARLRAPASDQAVSGVLGAMHDAAAGAMVEQGVSLLFATFGLLHWEEHNGDHRASPLLLLRARLDRKELFADYTLAAAEAVPRLELNPVLARYLREVWNFSLDERAEPWKLEELLDDIRERVKGKVNWRPEDETFLGLFPLEKFVLHEDVQRHREMIASHPVIKALAGAEPLPAAPVAPAGDNPWQVVDADASQRKAIAAVASGASLIIQGPPGTGKSQTITNIIAQALGRDQTVLFVSEKLAALEVVANRLAGVGLAPFCLALHGDGVNDHAVLAALDKASGGEMPDGAAAPAGAGVAGQDDRKQRRAELQQQIEGYFAALTDTNNPWGRSAYDVIGEIANLHDAPRVRFDWTTTHAGQLTAGHAKNLRETLDALVSLADIAVAPGTHPWHEIDPAAAPATEDTRYKLKERLDGFRDAAASLQAHQTRLRETWGLPAGRSRKDARWVVDLLGHAGERGERAVLRAWFEPHDFVAARTAAREQLDGRGALRGARAALHQRFTPAVIDRDKLDTFASERASEPILILAGEADAVSRPGRWQFPARFGAGLVVAALADARQATADVATILGMHAPATIQDARLLHELATLAAGTPPCHDWFLPETQAELTALAQEARTHATTLGQRGALLGEFRPEILDIDDKDGMLRRLQTVNPFEQFVSPADRDLARIRRLRVRSGPLAREDAIKALRAARDIRAAEAWFAARAADLDAGFGRFYHGPETTDWDGVLAAMDVATRAHHLVDPNNPPARLVDEPSPLTRDRRPLTRLETALGQADSAWRLFQDAVPEDEAAADDAFARTPVADLETDLRGKLAGSNGLFPLCDWLTTCRVAPWTSFNDLVADLHQAKAILDDDDRLRGLFAGQYVGLETDWNRILDALVWVDGIRTKFPTSVPPTFADRVLGHNDDEARRDSQALAGRIDTLGAARGRLLPSFRPDSFIATFGDDLPLDDLVAWADNLRARHSELGRWMRYVETRARAADLGLTHFVDDAIGKGIESRRWRDAFDLQLATLWLGWRQGAASALTDFDVDTADRMCAEFAALDEQWQRDNAQRLVARLSNRRAQRLADGGAQPEILALRKAAHAGTTPPLRQALGAVPNLLPTLKPCLLMSPTAVARYLGDQSTTFNLVVFDEASQIMTADVLGAIARANQAVVVGDSQQLPPTRFFAAGDANVASLLDECDSAYLPNHWLTWHYRSQYEDLITYSNRTFYDNRLVTFPSPRQDVDPLDVEIVQGDYDRGGTGTNKAEAARVLELVIAWAAAHPDDSIGIITFSDDQRKAVQEELDRRRQEPAIGELLREDGPCQLFVRNLERVQGDERDAIFFSIGYGPTASGQAPGNFGPLNRDGGDRRLNVAITRARKHVTIVCSFDPRGLLANSNEMVQKLGRYLVFAAGKPETRPKDTPKEPDGTAFPDAVAHALQQAGLHVIRDVGAGEFRIGIGVQMEAGSPRCVLGIDCDGSVYHAAPDIHDRERLRPKVLGDHLGWTLHRVWSVAWLNQRDVEIKRITDRVEALTAAIQAQANGAGRDGAPPTIGDDAHISVVLQGGPAPAVTSPVDSPAADPSPAASTPPPNGAAPLAAPTPAAPPVKTTPAPADGRPLAAEPTAPPKRPRKPRKPVAATDAPPDGAGPAAEPIASAPKPPTGKKPRTDNKPPAGKKPAGKKPRSGKAPAGTAVSEIKGLSAAARTKLAAAGIATAEALLAAAATDTDRTALASRLDVEPAELRGWVSRADLMRITGVGTDYADLLQQAGIASCRELRQRNPEHLRKALDALNATAHIVKAVPSAARLASWIAAAGTLADAEGAKR